MALLLRTINTYHSNLIEGHQVRYMASLLDLETLVHRIDDYVNRRARGLVDTPIPRAAPPLLREVLLRGEVPPPTET